VEEPDLVIPTNYVPNDVEFLGALGIRPNGLAAQLFKSVYDRFFVFSTDLRDQYERYYCVEYPDFETYLAVACDVYMDRSELEKTHVFSIKSLGGVVDTAYDDNALNAVVDCLRQLEADHENQNGLRFE